MAGKSSRMGTPKGLININGKTIIQTHLDRYSPLLSGEIVSVVSKNSPYQSELNKYQTTVIENDDPNSEQFYSIALALNNLTVTPLPTFITTIDKLPPLTTSLQTIYSYFDDNKHLHAVIPAHNQKKGHPPLLSPQFCLELLKVNPVSSEGRLDLQLRKLPLDKISTLEINDSTIIQNFNFVTDIFSGLT